jgi:hypothetical protein
MKSHNNPGEHAMKELSGLILMLLLAASTFSQQRGLVQGEGGAVLAEGNPPLTQRMVNRLANLFEFLLEIRLSGEQRERFQRGVIRYWAKNDRESMQNILTNLKYAELSQDELRVFREANQAIVVESMRRSSDAPEEAVLLEAYDRAHPDRRDATRARGFNDLVGTWSRKDALGASTNPYNGGVTGVSYTDSGTIEISANGGFKLIRQHTHCGSGCCRLDGSQEYGAVSIEGSMLVLQTKGGTKLVEDDCNPSLNQRVLVVPHRESFKWSIRPNPNNNANTLCWNTGPDTAICYEKQ